jgi:RNA polymerase sigma factor (sigma-70 family)
MADLDWLSMAQFVVQQMRVHGDKYEDAVQETALAGWLAAQRWSSDGGMSLQNWVFRQMERGLIDWLRVQLGRHGQHEAFRQSWKYLDEPDWYGNPIGDRIPTICTDYDRIEQGVDLCRLVRAAGLTQREREIILAYLSEETLKTTGARWGVTEARACQVRGDAMAKLQAAA